jgi:hypothetical protein
VYLENSIGLLMFASGSAPKDVDQVGLEAPRTQSAGWAITSVQFGDHLALDVGRATRPVINQRGVFIDRQGSQRAGVGSLGELRVSAPGGVVRRSTEPRWNWLPSISPATNIAAR